MTELLAALTRLVDVVEAENEALQYRDLRAAGLLLREKQEASAKLQCFTLENAAIAAPNEEEYKLAAKLHDSIIANKGLLERAIKAQRYVISILAHAAVETNRTSSYGFKGAYVGPRTPSAFAIIAQV